MISRFHFKVFLFLVVFAGVNYIPNYVSCENLDRHEEIIISHLELINSILNNPKAANMKNLRGLVNPNDESELMFYINSLSNGTLAAYQSNKAVLEKVIKHSKSVSKSEPSTLLYYLRISLMSQNKKLGVAPPSFELVKISLGKHNSIVAHCYFKSTDHSGSLVSKQSVVVFDIGSDSNSDVFLTKIIVGGQVLYGSWYP